MLKQDVECLINESLTCACPWEGSEQKRQAGHRVGNNTGVKCPQMPCPGDSAQLCLQKTPFGVNQPWEQPAGSLPNRLVFCPKKHFSCKSFLLRKAQALSRSVENVKTSVPFVSLLSQPFIALKKGLPFTQVQFYKTSLKSKITPVNIIQNNIQPL